MALHDLGVLIPIVAMMIPIVAITTRHKRRMAELELRRLEALGGKASDDRTEWLEDRVKVLERIVTDRGQNLAAEIEALRDERPAAPRRIDGGEQ